MPVTWDGEADTREAGMFTFKGTVAGYDEKVTLTLKVLESLTIVNIEDIEVEVNQDIDYTLPLVVQATMSDDSKQDVSVTWNGEADTSEVGVFTFEGTVVGYDGRVTLILTVVAPPAEPTVEATFYNSNSENSTYLKVNVGNIEDAHYVKVKYIADGKWNAITDEFLLDEWFKLGTIDGSGMPQVIEIEVFTENNKNKPIYTFEDVMPVEVDDPIPETYAITVVDVEGATVTTDPVNEAVEREVVTLTVDVIDETKEFESIMVRSASGVEMVITETDGNYTFVMPAEAVTVEVTLKDKTPDGPIITVAEYYINENNTDYDNRGLWIKIDAKNIEGAQKFKIEYINTQGKLVTTSNLSNLGTWNRVTSTWSDAERILEDTLNANIYNSSNTNIYKFENIEPVKVIEKN